jgi:hypothetical protein
MTTNRRILWVGLFIAGLFLLLAFALTDPAWAAPNARICTAWSKTCTHYRTFLGIRYCDAWKLTCVRYL